MVLACPRKTDFPCARFLVSSVITLGSYFLVFSFVLVGPPGMHYFVHFFNEVAQSHYSNVLGCVVVSAASFWSGVTGTAVWSTRSLPGRWCFSRAGGYSNNTAPAPPDASSYGRLGRRNCEECVLMSRISKSARNAGN